MFKIVILSKAILVILLSAIPLAEQQQHLNKQEIGQKFSEVWKKTQALQRTYQWKEKIEVLRDGEWVNTRIEQVSYSADGKLKRTVIRDEQAEMPTTFLIRQIAESAKAKMVRFMLDLSVFLNTYALSDNNSRYAFFNTATTTFSDKHGLLLVSGINVLTKGDRVNWWINTRTYSLTQATISTLFEGSKVDFNATYVNSPPGMNYMHKAEIRVPDKEIVVKLEFFDFVKR